MLQAQDRLEERRIKYNIACETKELQALARLAARQARLDDRELELALRREARQALREMRILELQAQGLPRPKPVPKKFSTREEIREYRRSIYYLRQARIKANGGSHTKAEIKALLQAQNYQCAYCKRRVKLTEDHIIPLVQGGRDDIANICMACGRCNRQKRARTPEQWIKRWYLQPPYNQSAL